MNFFIVDDDDAVRSMLCDIIEDYDLGDIACESSNGSSITPVTLQSKKVDILILDLLMPYKDGLEIVGELKNSFKGKFIMISQMEDKDTIGKAYSAGVQYYITKPINRLEVVGVIKNVIKHITLEKSIYKIKNTLDFLSDSKIGLKQDSKPILDKNITSCSKFLLNELGILSEKGSSDIISIMEYLYLELGDSGLDSSFPKLKQIFLDVSQEKLKKSKAVYSSEIIQKEAKAAEQRVRRAILQALNHIASLGLVDYSNAKFEDYSAEFFEFEEVRKRMLELNEDSSRNIIHINMKKFIKAFYTKVIRIL